MVYAKFQFVYASTSKIGNQLLLTSASSKFLLGRGSEKAFSGCPGLSNAFPLVAYVQIWVLSLIEAKQRYALDVLSNLHSFFFMKSALSNKFWVSEFSAG